MKIKDMPENNKEAREEKAELLARAQAVGLTDEATKKEVVDAEKGKPSSAKREKLPSEHLRIKQLPARNPKENDERNAWIDRAKVHGLDARATREEVVEAEKGKTPEVLANDPSSLVLRARRAGLQDWATEADIIIAEAAKKGTPTPDPKKVDLVTRARLSGLKDNATEAQIAAAEKVKGIDYSKNLEPKHTEAKETKKKENE